MRTCLSIVFGCILLAGCQQQPATQTATSSAAGQPAANAGKKFKIALIPKGTTHKFWKSVHAGGVKAARELGNVDLVWRGPEKEDDREQQVSLVQNFVSTGVSAIVLAPLDQK